MWTEGGGTCAYVLRPWLLEFISQSLTTSDAGAQRAVSVATVAVMSGFSPCKAALVTKDKRGGQEGCASVQS